MKPTSQKGAITLTLCAFNKESEPKFQKDRDWTPGFAEIEIKSPATAISIELTAIPVIRKPNPLLGDSQ